MKPSQAVVTAWIGIVRAQKCALAAVQAALKAAGHPPLEWYDVLLELERAGPLRPRELQARLLLAQSNLSRLLDRMEEARLVQATVCEDDRRGQVISATRLGRATLGRMWPVYAEAIQATVGNRLTDPEARVVAELLHRIGGAAPEELG